MPSRSRSTPRVVAVVVKDVPIQPMTALIYLSSQWLPDISPIEYSFWMASSEVDQKFLGHFAKSTSVENNYLSSFLFRTLGLSVLISEYLLTAHRAKTLDSERSTADRRLIHHILWLAREGLVMVEQYILPMVDHYLELKVLAYKLKGSFYHVFVLFHNDPPVNSRITRSRTKSDADLYPNPLIPRTSPTNSQDKKKRTRSPAISLGGPVGGTTFPPGLRPPVVADRDSADASFLLPLQDYTQFATNAFTAANTLAESLLPGSHPIRLSVKVEYVAYLYDCLGMREQSRTLARRSIREVYEAKEGMDDESFEDAAELVSILGRMMKRGLSQKTSPTSTQPPEQLPRLPTTTARVPSTVQTQSTTPTRTPPSQSTTTRTAQQRGTSTPRSSSGGSRSPARGKRRAGTTIASSRQGTNTGQATTWV